MCGVGAPVQIGVDTITVAISIYGPANRLTDTVLRKEYANRILKTENVIQKNL